MPPCRLVPEDASVPRDALRKAGLLNTDRSPQYDALAQLAACCCAADYAALLLLDEGQTWVKAQSGTCLDEPTALEGVAQHIAAEQAVRVCLNARDTPVGPLRSPFWAGCPVVLPASALCVGVLLVADPFPKRRIPSNLVKLLELLSQQAGHLLSGDIHMLEEWSRMNLFVAKVSHELRTPLNGILGMAALLQDRLGGSDLDVTEALQHVSASAEHNLKTVNQILDFAKLDAGRVELEQVPFDLRECVEDAMAMLPVDRKPPDVELGYEMAEDAEVIGDPHRLKQVLLNLLSNALKATPSGSVVLAVALAPDAALPPGHRRAHFAVRDTGGGIPGDVAARLFQPFAQGPAADPRPSGTGLGLTISRMLVEAMGGRLDFASSVGEGSVFRFSIAVPVRPADAPPLTFAGKRALLVGLPAGRTSLLLQHLAALQVEAVDLPSWDAGDPEALAAFDLAFAEGPPSPGSPSVPWALTGGAAPMSPSRLSSRGPCFALPPVISQRWLGRRLEELWCPNGSLCSLSFASSASFSPTLGPLGDPTVDLAGLRVLVVDDVRTNQLVLAGFLKRLECEFEVRGNGAEAVSAVADQQFDVVVLDLHMPVMDGFAAARELSAAQPRPYLLASSALVDAAVRRRCLQMGFDGILEKPLRLRQLRQALLMAKRSAGGDVDGGCSVEALLPVTPDASPQLTPYRSPLLKALTDNSLSVFAEPLAELGAAVSHNAGPATPHGNRFKLLSSLRTSRSLPPRAAPTPPAPPAKVPVPPKTASRRTSRMSTIVFSPTSAIATG
eukprot:EG_transcript_2730